MIVSVRYIAAEIFWLVSSCEKIRSLPHPTTTCHRIVFSVCFALCLSSPQLKRTTAALGGAAARLAVHAVPTGAGPNGRAGLCLDAGAFTPEQHDGRGEAEAERCGGRKGRDLTMSLPSFGSRRS